ncbi:MAG: Mov34/MPN/PAD-1 family protein [Anaerolineae bacterium]|nr:Mov34/MPN/PAD-1 family protein [Anaerolineae bacterium]
MAITILVPQKIREQLCAVLQAAGDNEIGGVLMGEHVEDNTFRVVEISVQSQRGTRSYFLRQLREAIFHLAGFFQRTNHNYRRFNYLGEWHSHPRFFLRPSATDKETMWDLVQDKQVGANFAVLLIVRLTNGTLDAAATVYLPDYRSMQAELVFDL